VVMPMVNRTSAATELKKESFLTICAASAFRGF
jgi:hypothetical protein